MGIGIIVFHKKSLQLFQFDAASIMVIYLLHLLIHATHCGFSFQKVTVNGARQTHFLLWKVNRQSLCQHVLDEMYHAALNLRLRIAHELDQEKEVCD